MKLSLVELQNIETEMIAEVARICERHNIVYFLGYGSVIGAVRHNGPIPWDSDMDIVVPITQIDKFIDIVRKEMSDKFYIDYYDSNPNYRALFPRMGLKGYSTNTLHIDIFKLIGTSSELSEQKEHRKQLRKYWNYYKLKQTNRDYLISTSLKRKIAIVAGKLLLSFVKTKTLKDKFLNYCNKYPYESAEYVINANEGYSAKGTLKKTIYGEGMLVNYKGIKLKIPFLYKEYLTHFYGDFMKLPPEKAREVKDFYHIKKDN